MVALASVALLTLLGAVSGFALAGTLRSRLRLWERLAIAVTGGLVLDTTACFLLSLGLGLGPASIFLAPVAVTALFCAAVRFRPAGLVQPWRESLDDAGSHSQAAWAMAIIAAIAALVSVLFLSRSMYQDAAGNLVTGYWIPDWSQHLITASSFSVAGNLPPQNPIMSGTPLYYPFIPDFTSAMLMRLGLTPGTSLWLPQAVLGVVLVVLVVSLAERLGARRSVGVLAVVICLLGGGLGFVGAFHDSCTTRGYSSSECSAGYVLSHPVEGVGITAATIGALPGVAADQPRSYDGMPTLQPQGATPVFTDQEWYTPLFAWWLPQRTLMMGFAVVLAVLTLLFAAFAGVRARLWDVGVAGVLAGLLLVVHVQSLFALGIIVVGLAAMRWRRGWLVFAGVAAVVAAPRLVQLLGAPHGAAALGNQYPWFEPGWMSNAINSTTLAHTVTPSTLATGLAGALRVPFTGTFWSFWFVNLGIAVPLSVAVAIATLVRRLSGRRLGDRVILGIPGPLLRFLLACMPVFVVANVLVLQSWDWDNTKLLTYWYLGAALLIAAVTVHLWRGVWRRILTVVIVGSVLATGTLGVIRLLPFTPAAVSITGPYTVASAAEMRMAVEVEARTADDAVFLGSPAFDDPIPLLTGRPVVMGYTGWLWSYGLDYAQRQHDVTQVLNGCGGTAIGQCRPILTILHRYDVGYVEIDVSQPGVNGGWWASQNLSVIASAPGITIYDVRGYAG